MHGDVVCFVALDLILRLAFRGVMRVPFIVHVSRMDLYDSAADMAGLGVPGHMIANFESPCHIRPR